MAAVAGLVKESVRSVILRVADFLPSLLGAILILLLGLLIGKIVQWTVVRFLKLFRVDVLSEQLRIAELLRRGEIRYTLSELLGIFVYWIIVLAFVLAALNAVGLTTAAELVERVLSFIPNVLAGIIVLVLGILLGSVVSGAVQTAAINYGIAQAKALGHVAQAVVIVLAAAVALEKFLSSVIIQNTINTLISAVAYGVALGVALAFGLGCKDLAGRVASAFFERLRTGRR